MKKKLMGSGKSKKADKTKSPKTPGKKEKKDRMWDNGGTQKEAVNLDYSRKNGNEDSKDENPSDNVTNINKEMVKTMKGDLQDIEVETDDEELEDSEVEEESVDQGQTSEKQAKTTESSKSWGMFSMFSGLVGNKTITREDMRQVLDKLRDQLIAKNVASDIA